MLLSVRWRIATEISILNRRRGMFRRRLSALLLLELQRSISIMFVFRPLSRLSFRLEASEMSPLMVLNLMRVRFRVLTDLLSSQSLRRFIPRPQSRRLIRLSLCRSFVNRSGKAMTFSALKCLSLTVSLTLTLLSWLLRDNQPSYSRSATSSALIPRKSALTSFLCRASRPSSRLFRFA